MCLSVKVIQNYVQKIKFKLCIDNLEDTNNLVVPCSSLCRGIKKKNN